MSDLKELAAALAKAQGSFKHAELDRENPHFKSKYSSLAATIDACKLALAENGLATSQSIERSEHGLIVRTILMHCSGQSISSICPVITDKMSMQALGSALTYARRYSFAALVGVASKEGSLEDDDGHEASQGNKHLNSHKPAESHDQTEYATQVMFDTILATAASNGVSIDDVKIICASYGAKTSHTIPIDCVAEIIEEVKRRGLGSRALNVK
jgi:hypothetical protein